MDTIERLSLLTGTMKRSLSRHEPGGTFKALLLAGVLAILPAHSASLQDQAQTAALTDGLSTLSGLALGAAEANPLGLITLVAKAPMLAAVKNMPQDEQANWHASYSAIWGAATANNLCIIGVILTGGVAAPFCPVVGVAWGLQKWSESATERELWAICREERAYWNNPQMPCDFFQKPSSFVGVAEGPQKLSESATERELWAICREERAYWNNPQMPCDFFQKPSS